MENSSIKGFVFLTLVLTPTVTLAQEITTFNYECCVLKPPGLNVLICEMGEQWYLLHRVMSDRHGCLETAQDGAQNWLRSQSMSPLTVLSLTLCGLVKFFSADVFLFPCWYRLKVGFLTSSRITTTGEPASVSITHQRAVGKTKHTWGIRVVLAT